MRLYKKEKEKRLKTTSKLELGYTPIEVTIVLYIILFTLGAHIMMSI